ncbi:Tannase/feruloyl esterase [Microdochium trichocladiopsis]|uniref:Carboxylic ester hydrolase n=1 Tax=Microdochium trichocladiopsis TaxID=1682393 RepID=A0A9P9BIV8_9PEZI|nr:Tannase/feruloyl esterase [Microdochium trichocladiopsis]KAH7024653.1 Tannase/feruloyl esterase [Microdochium trichocladiopsis]
MSDNLPGLCIADTFSSLSLLGAEILSTVATLVTGFTAESPAIFRMTQPGTVLSDATFCNITVSYTHPGQNDEVFVETWLPISSSSEAGNNTSTAGGPPAPPTTGAPLGGAWNGRLQGVGGGGLVPGRSLLSYMAMYGALADGYATVTTDAGLPQGVGPGDPSSSWALLSPGNVNLYKLQNLASVSLDDEAKIAKSLITAFYKSPPKYSYFNGCSQGGRQALMLAQRYPDAYDGIIAGAPGIYWTELIPLFQWPQQIMNMRGGNAPYSCEMDAINAAAVRACDGLDGVVDGVVSEPEECLRVFDPMGMVGKAADACESMGVGTAGGGNGKRRGNVVRISETAAAVVKGMWEGMTTSDKKHIYHGLYPPADITGNDPLSYPLVGIAATTCPAPLASGWETECKGKPYQSGVDWLQLFVAKDPSLDVSKLSHEQWDQLVRKSGREYRSIIGAEDVDLSEFKQMGGKIMSFHGLADGMVPPAATRKYYQDVLALDHSARETFFRHFEIPGLGHCLGGRGSQPSSMFSQLRAWVEKGQMPDSSPVTVKDLDGGIQERWSCAWPEKPVFDKSCGDSGKRACWKCR